jgi:perosamine synthetase
VFEEYQRLQRELERNPVEFLARDRRFPELHDAARDELARYVGADPQNLVFVPNATTGINVVAQSLGLGAGDEVVITDHEYGAIDLLWRVVCERAGARLVRVAVPVLRAEVAETVLAAVTPRTRAVVAVDIFGFPCELDPLRAIAARHGLTVIDDACEALGAEYKGAPVGSHGVSAVFAFYPNKQVATGEGGIVTTHSEDEWKLLRSLRNQGRSYEGGRWFHHPFLGFNYRWTDLQAAVGVAQMERLDELLELRSAAATRYNELLSGTDAVTTPAADDDAHTRSWFVYVVELDESVDRAHVSAELAAQGIECGEYLPCIHLQPYMRERYGFAEGLCPVAESISYRTLALPFFPQIGREDQERVVDALLAAVD